MAEKTIGIKSGSLKLLNNRYVTADISHKELVEVADIIKNELKQYSSFAVKTQLTENTTIYNLADHYSFMLDELNQTTKFTFFEKKDNIVRFYFYSKNKKDLIAIRNIIDCSSTNIFMASTDLIQFPALTKNYYQSILTKMKEYNLSSSITDFKENQTPLVFGLKNDITLFKRFINERYKEYYVQCKILSKVNKKYIKDYFDAQFDNLLHIVWKDYADYKYQIQSSWGKMTCVAFVNMSSAEELSNYIKEFIESIEYVVFDKNISNLSTVKDYCKEVKVPFNAIIVESETKKEIIGVVTTSKLFNNDLPKNWEDKLKDYYKKAVGDGKIEQEKKENKKSEVKVDEKKDEKVVIQPLDDECFHSYIVQNDTNEVLPKKEVHTVFENCDDEIKVSVRNEEDVKASTIGEICNETEIQNVVRRPARKGRKGPSNKLMKKQKKMRTEVTKKDEAKNNKGKPKSDKKQEDGDKETKHVPVGAAVGMPVVTLKDLKKRKK